MTNPHPINRRTFVKSALLAAASAGATSLAFAQSKTAAANPLPRWRGFNLQDFYSPDPSRGGRGTSDEELKWIVDWGFDFVRLPMAYPNYLDFDRSKNISPADVFKINERQADRIESFVRGAQKLGLHVNLNLHRAPGYCINSGFTEPYDLWKSAEAQRAFAFHWGMWGKRFMDVPSSKISFDLLNEPSVRADLGDQHSRANAVPGDLYRDVARKAVEAIRSSNPGHLVIADGNKIGNAMTPELKELGIAQSCRGYFPGQVSHYKAPWANKDPDKCPTPVWPGTINGERFDRARLEAYYQPWIELARGGIGVHCGECGCWNKTPHAVFLSWFQDVLDVLTTNKIGYALWNFRGPFGLLDSGRQDVNYEDWHGRMLDGKLLALLKRH